MSLEIPAAAGPGGEPSQLSPKRRTILAAATELFLRNGYLGTSMDEVAARAGVSKQTVYKHFSDKEGLFSEIVATTLAEVRGAFYGEVIDLAASGDIVADLVDLARRQLAVVLQPRLLQLRRLVIGESARFPELGRAFYEQGPERMIGVLATALEELAGRGTLRVDDPQLAAAHFNWLVFAIPLNRAMFLGDDEPASEAQRDLYAESAVRVFLAAYGAE